ncbi:MAG: hypothetical protein WBE13_04175 [Candidatus Acidiferrum sp.]
MILAAFRHSKSGRLARTAKFLSAGLLRILPRTTWSVGPNRARKTAQIGRFGPATIRRREQAAKSGYVGWLGV